MYENVPIGSAFHWPVTPNQGHSHWKWFKMINVNGARMYDRSEKRAWKVSVKYSMFKHLPSKPASQPDDHGWLHRSMQFQWTFFFYIYLRSKNMHDFFLSQVSKLMYTNSFSLMSYHNWIRQKEKKAHKSIYKCVYKIIWIHQAQQNRGSDWLRHSPSNFVKIWRPWFLWLSWQRPTFIQSY